MRILKTIGFLFTALIAGQADAWNYTVHNNTPYHMVVSFNRIGLFDNPVTMTPNTSTTVSSVQTLHLLPIDYCYAGAHLLIQPTLEQKTPQVMLNGVPVAITPGKLPGPDALQELETTMTKDRSLASKAGAAIGALGGAAAGAIGGFVLGAAAGFSASAGITVGGGVGFLEGEAAGDAVGLIGGLITISANEVFYQAPYIPIIPDFDACWNRTITLNYDASTNQIVASIA